MLVAMGFWEKAQAANDTLFLPARHRTLPILATVTPIANYPTKLRIFKTLASRYWQVRSIFGVSSTNGQMLIHRNLHKMIHTVK